MPTDRPRPTRREQWTAGFCGSAPYGAQIAVFDGTAERIELSVPQARGLRDALTWALQRARGRPGGPAEPPGPSWGGAITRSWGERIAAQFFQEYDARWGADPRTTPYEARLPDLARRIDAALAEAKQAGTAIIHDEARAIFVECELAEREAQIAMLVETFRGIADHYSECNCRNYGICDRRAKMRLAIAGDRADAAVRCVERAKRDGAIEERTRLSRALNEGDLQYARRIWDGEENEYATINAYAVALERARQEGAEEMRELIARLVDAKQEAWDRKGEQHPAETCSKIAAAIRGLGSRGGK